MDERGLMFYLKHEYLFGEQKEDYVGPFSASRLARIHRNLFGPVDAMVVELDTAPEYLMSPREHVDLVMKKF
jgi:hypothetical protein